MKVKFLCNADIRGKVFVPAGTECEAVDKISSYEITLPDGCIIRAPKSEIAGVLEIIPEF